MQTLMEDILVAATPGLPLTIPAARLRAPAPARSKPIPQLREYTANASGRAPVEQFIRAEFLDHFGARIGTCMPTLIATHEHDGSVRAAVGIRDAAQGPLFLETYTHRPIEQVIRATLGAQAPREAIVEVGNLACRSGRAAMELVTALAPALIERGYAWVVFTGADTVRNVFRHLQLQPQALCIANKALLGPAQVDWGSYYDHHPIVMTGRLADGIAALDSLPRVQ
jgi:hypothetical protein